MRRDDGYVGGGGHVTEEEDDDDVFNIDDGRDPFQKVSKKMQNQQQHHPQTQQNGSTPKVEVVVPKWLSTKYLL